MIGRVVFALIDAAFGVAMAADEGAYRVKRLARRVRERLLPSGDDEPMPLSWKDVEHQRDQVRRATAHGVRTRGETIRPPPPEH